MDSNATKLLWKKFTEIFKQKKILPKGNKMWDFLLLLNKTIQKIIPTYVLYVLPPPKYTVQG